MCENSKPFDNELMVAIEMAGKILRAAALKIEEAERTGQICEAHASNLRQLFVNDGKSWSELEGYVSDHLQHAERPATLLAILLALAKLADPDNDGPEIDPYIARRKAASTN